MDKLIFREFAVKYCDRQMQTPTGLLAILKDQKALYQCDGWFMAEAQLMDSSWLGSLVILPYGGKSTHKLIPDHPFSPRGLASDTSVVVAFMTADELPVNVTFTFIAPEETVTPEEGKPKRKRRKK